MTIHWFFMVAGFIAVMVMTPGPNNIMMATSGALFGLRRTLPLICGAVLGPLPILLLVATGGHALLNVAWFRDGLRILCLLYLLYLAYKIATSKPPHLTDNKVNNPLTLTKVLALQWLNPKVWSQYIMVISVYVTPLYSYSRQVLFLLLMFIVISIPSALLWTMFGKLIARYLKHSSHFQLFNIVMAIILLVTVVPVVWENFV